MCTCPSFSGPYSTDDAEIMKVSDVLKAPLVAAANLTPWVFAPLISYSLSIVFRLSQPVPSSMESTHAFNPFQIPCQALLNGAGQVFHQTVNTATRVGRDIGVLLCWCKHFYFP